MSTDIIARGLAANAGSSAGISAAGGALFSQLKNAGYSIISTNPGMYNGGLQTNGMALQSLAINAAGSGYVAGEIITLSGGAQTQAAKVIVLTVSGGAITSIAVWLPGLFSTTSTTFTQASTTGSGTGATFNNATFAVSGSTTDTTFKVAHIATANASDIKLVYGNFWATGATGLIATGYNPVMIGSALQKRGPTGFTDDTGEIVEGAFKTGRTQATISAGGIVVTEPMHFNVNTNEVLYTRNYISTALPQPPAAPTLTAVSTGGGLTGNTTYYVCLLYIFPDGIESYTSAATSITTPTGTNTCSIIVTPPTAAAGAIGYEVLVSTSSNNNFARASVLSANSNYPGQIASATDFALNTVIIGLGGLYQYYTYRPAGARYFPCGNGILGGTNYFGVNSGEGINYGRATSADKPALIQVAQGNVYSPLAILGKTATPMKTVALIGDSIQRGTGDSGMTSGGHCARALTNQFNLAYQFGTPLQGLAVNFGGSGHAIGDVLTLAGGTFTTAAQITVTSVGSLSYLTGLTASGGSNYYVGDVITLGGGTSTVQAQITVTSVSGGAITGYSILAAGVYSATSATLTQASTTGVGSGATFTSATFGTATGSITGFTISRAGSYTVFPATLTQGSTTGSGTGATFGSTVFSGFTPAPAYGYVSVPQGGDTLAMFASLLNTQYTQDGSTIYGGNYARNRPWVTTLATNVISNYGRNDVAGGFAAYKTNLLNVANWYQSLGIKFIQLTILPATTSSNGFKDLAGQTLETFRSTTVAMNTWLRDTGPNGFIAQTINPSLAAVIDICAPVEVNSSNVLTQNGGYLMIPPTPGGSITGTFTSGNSSTQFNDSTKSWTQNQWKGWDLLVTSGAAAGQGQNILYNTATAINFGGSFSTTPATGDSYILTQMSTHDGTHPAAYIYVMCAQTISAALPGLLI